MIKVGIREKEGAIAQVGIKLPSGATLWTDSFVFKSASQKQEILQGLKQDLQTLSQVCEVIGLENLCTYTNLS
jgi:ABC-type sulfate transport system substrate-binding protein